jgi:protein phosphatase
MFLRDLQPYAQTNVRRGMIANSGLDGAREIIGRLRTNDLLPLCPRAGTGTPPAGVPSSITEPSAEGNPTTSTPTTSTPTTSTTAAPTTTGTPLPEKPSEPGVDCRTVN